MPMTELPLRSVGPEPAMMSATGTAPLAPRGTVSVAASPRSPLRTGYGDSIAAADGTVSAFAGGGAWPRAAGARTTSASAAMSGLLMLLPPPQDVRLHDRHRDRQGRSGDEQHPRHRPGHECRRDHQHAGDHEREATGAMRLPPHRVARQRPRRADPDEPGRLHARQRVAEEEEEQPHAHRHEAGHRDGG